MKNYKEIFEWIKPIAFIVAATFLVNLSVGIVAIKGDSMIPTLNDRDYFLINKLSYIKDSPSRFDIVVFRSNLIDVNGEKKRLIKRVIGLPDEKISIKDGIIYVDNIPIDEKYLLRNFTSKDMELIVPEGKFFVMGDNRDISFDSRDQRVGCIDIEEIYGKLWIKIFPL